MSWLLLCYSLVWQHTASKFFAVITEQREQIPISVAIENEKLLQECCPQHFCMGKAIMIKHKETHEEEIRKEWKDT